MMNISASAPASDSPMSRVVRVGQDVRLGNTLPLVLIAGPCAMETRQHAFDMAGALRELALGLSMPFIYKTSFDKANRTSIKGKRGAGLDEALRIFSDLKKELGVSLLTDVHLPEQCALLGDFVDVLQIPAYLCRQTDLLLAAGKTGKVVNVKKGQFLAPWDMQNVAEKLASTGNENILLCERGTCFGYNALVSDMRALPVLKETGYPVVYDATHSVQRPGGLGGASGGERAMVPVLARAAVSIGVAGVFVETHQDPDSAPSDGPNMVKLADMPRLLETLQSFDRLAKGL